MTDKFARMARQLSSLLGSLNVVQRRENIVAKPSSNEEIAEIFGLAAQAELTVEAAGYTLGPAVGTAVKADIIISLERMNQIKFDRESLIIMAQPAAEMNKITGAARETGCKFPGATCQHKYATVGENVAACFNEGEPDFKCPTACLCGLELVLADGRIINVGEKSAKGLDNYQLTYILGGYKEEKAVLGGIYLRVLSKEQEQYWLITICKDLDTLAGIWPPLMQNHRRDLGAVMVVKPANHPELAGILRQWIPDFSKGDHSSAACILASVNCHPGDMEPLMELLTGDQQDGGQTDTSIAGGTYQKLVISTFYNNLLRELVVNPQLSNVATDEQDYIQLNNIERLYAVHWLKEEGKVQLFYQS